MRAGDLEQLVARPAEAPDDGGFSLVELTVVMVILAILVGIATATYFSQRERAGAAAAQQALRTVSLFAESIRGDQPGYSDDLGSYTRQSTSYVYVDGSTASTDPEMVSIQLGASGDELALSSQANGTCYYLRLRANRASYRTTGAVPADGSCSADEYATGADTGWS